MIKDQARAFVDTVYPTSTKGRRGAMVIGVGIVLPLLAGLLIANQLYGTKQIVCGSTGYDCASAAAPGNPSAPTYAPATTTTKPSLPPGCSPKVIGQIRTVESLAAPLYDADTRNEGIPPAREHQLDAALAKFTTMIRNDPQASDFGSAIGGIRSDEVGGTEDFRAEFSNAIDAENCAGTS